MKNIVVVQGTFFQCLTPLITLLLHSMGRNTGVPVCKIISAAFCALLYDARSTYHLWSGSSHAFGCSMSVCANPSGEHDGSLSNDSIGVFCLISMRLLDECCIKTVKFEFGN